MSSTDLKKSIQRLLGDEEGWKPLETPPAKGGKGASRSVGRPGASQTTPGGGVITEDDYDAREYWDAHTVVTSDYLFAIEYKPIKSILDVSGDRHTFKEPTS